MNTIAERDNATPMAFELPHVVFIVPATNNSTRTALGWRSRRVIRPCDEQTTSGRSGAGPCRAVGRISAGPGIGSAELATYGCHSAQKSPNPSRVHLPTQPQPLRALRVWALADPSGSTRVGARRPDRASPRAGARRPVRTDPRRRSPSDRLKATRCSPTRRRAALPVSGGRGVRAVRASRAGTSG